MRRANGPVVPSQVLHAKDLFGNPITYHRLRALFVMGVDRHENPEFLSRVKYEVRRKPGYASVMPCALQHVFSRHPYYKERKSAYVVSADSRLPPTKTVSCKR